MEIRTSKEQPEILQRNIVRCMYNNKVTNKVEDILEGNDNGETTSYFRTFNDNEITTINNFQT